MKLEFNRLPKNKMIGVRLTEEEYRKVESLAKKNKVSLAEATGVIIRAALKEIKDI